MTSTKKVNKKTLDKNKTKKHKINNKGGFGIGPINVDQNIMTTKNLEKARDYFKPHENAGKTCGHVNECKLQPKNGNMAVPDDIDCIDGICRTKSIKGTVAKVLNNRLKDLTTGFTSFFEDKESKTQEGNESDAAKKIQQKLLNEQCNMEGNHIVACYNVGDVTQCLLYDMEQGIMELKMDEENSNRITIPENSNADAILNAISLNDRLFQDIVYENLKNIDKSRSVLKNIRSEMYKSVEFKIKEQININTNNEDIVDLNKTVFPDQSPSKSSEEKNKQDVELLKEINDINTVKKNTNIISQATAACTNITENKSDKKNYKTYISSLTHFMLYYTFYFYKKDDGKQDTLTKAITNDIEKIKSSMANVHNTIKLSLHFGKGNYITDKDICDFFSKKILAYDVEQRLNRQELYEIYTNNKNTDDGDDVEDGDGENTVDDGENTVDDGENTVEGEDGDDEDDGENTVEGEATVTKNIEV